MKRRMLTILLFLVATMLLGCQRQETPNAAEATEASAVIEVSTVDQLLDAIGSNREIHLLPGSYNLSQASTYGKPSGSTSYRWADVFDGYTLELNGVENLTIVGSGMENTTLLANDRWANVLQFKKCHNISLSGFTAGHTLMEDTTCSGSVIFLLSSEVIQLTDVGLNGCGACGLEVSFCRDILLENSKIYDCSNSGLTLSDSSDVTIQGCSFVALGNAYDGFGVWLLSNMENTRLQDCTIDNCQLSTLLCCCTSQKTVISNMSVTDCVFNDGFQLDCDLTLNGATFTGTKLSNWLPWDYGTLRDGSGRTLTEKELSELFPDTRKVINTQVGQEAVTPVISGDQKQVKVSTVDEFLAAIGPDTDILLDAPVLVLSDASDYGVGQTDYYYWEETYDGPGLVIRNVDNFSIHAFGNEITEHQIQSSPRYANVLSFDNCGYISLSGFTAGHTGGEGECTGGVLMFRNSRFVLVEGCGLFGCGTLGVDAEFCYDIQVKNCDIYECSYGGIQMLGCQRIDIGGCAFRDLGGNCYTFWSCEEVFADGEVRSGDYCGN